MCKILNGRGDGGANGGGSVSGSNNGDGMVEFVTSLLDLDDDVGVKGKRKRKKSVTFKETVEEEGKGACINDAVWGERGEEGLKLYGDDAVFRSFIQAISKSCLLSLWSDGGVGGDIPVHCAFSILFRLFADGEFIQELNGCLQRDLKLDCQGSVEAFLKLCMFPLLAKTNGKNLTYLLRCMVACVGVASGGDKGEGGNEIGGGYLRDLLGYFEEQGGERRVREVLSCLFQAAEHCVLAKELLNSWFRHHQESRKLLETNAVNCLEASVVGEEAAEAWNILTHGFSVLQHSFFVLPALQKALEASVARAVGGGQMGSLGAIGDDQKVCVDDDEKVCGVDEGSIEFVCRLVTYLNEHNCLLPNDSFIPFFLRILCNTAIGCHSVNPSLLTQSTQTFLDSFEILLKKTPEEAFVAQNFEPFKAFLECIFERISFYKHLAPLEELEKVVEVAEKVLGVMIGRVKDPGRVLGHFHRQANLPLHDVMSFWLFCKLLLPLFPDPSFSPRNPSFSPRDPFSSPRDLSSTSSEDSSEQLLTSQQLTSYVARFCAVLYRLSSSSSSSSLSVSYHTDISKVFEVCLKHHVTSFASLLQPMMHSCLAPPFEVGVFHW